MPENENVLVSAVMAFHNGDNIDVTKTAIDSVLSQTHKNLELIISVGGDISADKSAMLNKYCQNDARVKIFNSKINTGPSFSRNRGIEIASGKYVSIIDSDDIFFEDKIEKQLVRAIEKNLDFLGCGYLEFRNNHKSEKHVQRILPATYQSIKRALPFANPVANSALFIKADVIKEFLYDEKFRPGDGEDYDLLIRLLKAGKTAENIAQPLFFYRLGDNFEKKHANLRCSAMDLQHKLKAAAILPFWWFPAIFLSAVLAFICRLLPPEMFRTMRNFRHSFFGGKSE